MTESALTVKKMTDKEARECVDKINAGLDNVRHLVLDLYEQEGWKAMGYDNFRECAAKVFKQGQSYLYRQLEAAQIERNISTMVENNNSPMGEKEIPERQLRPLSKLEPAQQRIAWTEAVKTAPEGGMTAAHITKVVKEMTKKPAKPKIVNKNVGPRKEVDEEFNKAYKSVLEAIKGATLSKWQTMKQDTAVEMLQQLIVIIQNQKRRE